VAAKKIETFEELCSLPIGTLILNMRINSIFHPASTKPCVGVTMIVDQARYDRVSNKGGGYVFTGIADKKFFRALYLSDEAQKEMADDINAETFSECELYVLGPEALADFWLHYCQQAEDFIEMQSRVSEKVKQAKYTTFQRLRERSGS